MESPIPDSARSTPYEEQFNFLADAEARIMDPNHSRKSKKSPSVPIKHPRLLLRSAMRRALLYRRAIDTAADAGTEELMGVLRVGNQSVEALSKISALDKQIRRPTRRHKDETKTLLMWRAEDTRNVRSSKAIEALINCGACWIRYVNRQSTQTDAKFRVLRAAARCPSLSALALSATVDASHRPKYIRQDVPDPATLLRLLKAAASTRASVSVGGEISRRELKLLLRQPVDKFGVGLTSEQAHQVLDDITFDDVGHVSVAALEPTLYRNIMKAVNTSLNVLNHAGMLLDTMVCVGMCNDEHARASVDGDTTAAAQLESLSRRLQFVASAQLLQHAQGSGRAKANREFRQTLTEEELERFASLTHSGPSFASTPADDDDAVGGDAKAIYADQHRRLERGGSIDNAFAEASTRVSEESKDGGGKGVWGKHGPTDAQISEMRRRHRRLMQRNLNRAIDEIMHSTEGYALLITPWTCDRPCGRVARPPPAAMCFSPVLTCPPTCLFWQVPRPHRRAE